MPTKETKKRIRVTYRLRECIINGCTMDYQRLRKMEKSPPLSKGD
jgi:hypothetical protein